MTEIIDNRAFRIRTMKEIIRHLHEGGDAGEVRAKLKELVRETDSSEIAAMEQQLIGEGMPVEQVQSMCDLHSSVLQEILVEPDRPKVLQGHPIDTFQRENVAIQEAVGELRRRVAELEAKSPAGVDADALFALREPANRLMDIDKHYQRKEHLLFSCLERHGITGPSKVMWGKDDEVRQSLRRLMEAFEVSRAQGAQEALRAVRSAAEPALRAIQEMIVKEEKILLPMAASTLTEEEWGEIWRQSPEYGWCLVEPREGYQAPSPTAAPAPADLPANRAVMLPTGALSMQQLSGLFATLPVDLTFVDAEDRVRYFSEGAERIFARSKAILGRKVQHCHPPKSAHIVEKILDDFRQGRQNVAEFWINFREKFIHIRYFAVRDESGQYQGTLEVTQDVTRIRALEGERRLLQYGQ
jgi:PAS domain S-box-containing protein